MLILLFLCLAQECLAQEKAQFLRNITVSEGLPQGFVSCMVQDSKGFIWVGTRNGLARYDGRKFKKFQYDPNDKIGLSWGILSHMWIDKKDRLWISYESGDVDLFDTGTEKVTHLTDKKPFCALKGQFKSGRSFVEDKQGRFWILTNSGDIYIVDKSLKKNDHLKLSAELRKKDAVTGIAVWSNRVILTTNGNIIYLDENKNIVKQIPIPYKWYKADKILLPHNDNSVLVRHDGELIIPDYECLIIYHPERGFKKLELPARKHTHHMWFPRVIDKQGNVYFEYDYSEIWKLDSNNNLIRWAPAQPGNKSLLIDRSGVLWAGTNGMGIEQFDLRINHLRSTATKTEFNKDMLEMAGLSLKDVSHTFIDTTDSYHWRWLYSRNNTLYIAQTAIYNPPQRLFAVSRDENVDSPKWILKNGDSKPYPIAALSESKSGEIWGVTHDMRLLVVDIAKKTISFRYQIPYDMGDAFVNEINGLVADQNDYWVSSTVGLLHYNAMSGRVHRYLPKMRILSIYNDADNNKILWIGTSYGGLIKFNINTKHFESFKTNDGLPDNTVYAILPDGAGNLWCSTNKGIFSFRVKDNKVRSFTVLGDNKLLEFNRYHYFKFPDGKLAFGGSGAFVVFDPGQLLNDTYRPELVITSLSVNNNKITASDITNNFGEAINSLALLKLPYNKNFLTFEFAATEYNMPDKLQYRYMLKGLDSDWVYSGTNNIATYTTIPPGNYELYINASNTAGGWSNNIKKIKVVIMPPFWQTWWFILSIITFISFMIYFGVRKKLADTRKKDVLRLTFEREAMQLEARALRSQMNPHFIFNCLNSIKSLIHGQQNKEAALYLTTFAQLLRSQLNNNLLEISLFDELHTCKLYLKLEGLRFGSKLDYEFDIEPILDCHNIRIPALLLQPFIENAIIHGLLPLPLGGKITVSVYGDGNTVYCKIDDNGVGRNQASKNTSHVSKGVTLVQERLDLYNKIHEQASNIKIIDKLDNGNLPAGTLVIITLNF